MSTMGYVSTLEGAAASASLSLDFEKQSYRIMEGGKQVSKNFDELLTFTRATTGGRFNEKGLYEAVPANQPRFDYDPITKVLKGLLVEEQRTNLVIYSDNLAALSNVRSTTLRNAALAPDGTYTAAKLVNDSVADWHFTRTNLILASVDGILSASVFAKAGEYPRVRLASGDNTVFSRSAVFDLESGVVVQGGSNGSMTSVGNGWWRCTLSLLGLKVGNAPFTIGAAKAGELDTNTAGNGGGLYLWGAQGENGAFPTTYIPTEATFTSRASTATYFDKNGVLRTADVNVPRTGAYLYDESNNLVPAGLILESSSVNLLKMSSNYTLAPWSRIPTSVFVSDGGLAPDGSISQRFSLVGTTGHNINNSLSSALDTSTTYTLSVWLRAVNYTASAFQIAYYDGGVSVNQKTAYLTPEWKRHTFTFVPLTVAAAPQVRLVGYGIGNDGDTFEMWGAQLEVGAAATSYIPTGATFTGRASTATYLDSQGIVQTAAAGVARSDTYKYDVNGVLRSAGLLLENSSTNLMRNSQAFTGTGWSKSGSNLPTITDNTTTAPDGTLTAGTLTMTATGSQDSNLSQQFTTTLNGSYTSSIYLKATGAEDLGKQILIRHAGNSSYFTVTLTSTWQRIERTELANSTIGVFTVTLRPLLAGSSGVVNVDLWGAQVESGFGVTSYIPTAAATVTRAADVFTSSTATRAADVSTSVATTRVSDVCSSEDISKWYNQSYGTIVTSSNTAKVVGTADIISLGGVGTSHGIRVYTTGTNSSGLIRDADGPDVVLNVPNRSTDRTRALRIKTADYGFCSGGSAVVRNTSTETPIPVRLQIGGTSNFILNGYIFSVKYYTVSLSDSQLQLITA